MEAWVYALLILGVGLLIIAIGTLAVLLEPIGVSEFHRIPEHARDGDKLSRYYLRLIYAAFVSVGLAFLLELVRRRL